MIEPLLLPEPLLLEPQDSSRTAAGPILEAFQDRLQTLISQLEEQVHMIRHDGVLEHRPCAESRSVLNRLDHHLGHAGIGQIGAPLGAVEPGFYFGEQLPLPFQAISVLLAADAAQFG
ncbi:MAG TPA: hypothetical protein VFV87_20335 [Pirellulaceae bacterium]|nr:hypothetical protein [Pirellulaceae bacterium]